MILAVGFTPRDIKTKVLAPASKGVNYHVDLSTPACHNVSVLVYYCITHPPAPYEYLTSQHQADLFSPALASPALSL